MNEPTEPKADWLGWWVQFIVGGIIGLLLGCAFASKGRYSRGWWVNENYLYEFIIGAGLIVGAMASQYGDRLWMENTSSMFPEEGIKQTQFSNLCSLLIGIAGVAMIIYAVLKTFTII